MATAGAKDAERVRQDKRQFVKAASTFRIRDQTKQKPVSFYRKLAEEQMGIDTSRSKRWFSDLTNHELDELAALVTESRAYKIDASYTARQALRDFVAKAWEVDVNALTEDEAWKCVKDDTQRHSHFLFNRAHASGLRLRLASYPAKPSNKEEKDSEPFVVSPLLASIRRTSVQPKKPASSMANLPSTDANGFNFAGISTLPGSSHENLTLQSVPTAALQHPGPHPAVAQPPAAQAPFPQTPRQSHSFQYPSPQYYTSVAERTIPPAQHVAPYPEPSATVPVAPSYPTPYSAQVDTSRSASGARLNGSSYPSYSEGLPETARGPVSYRTPYTTQSHTSTTPTTALQTPYAQASYTTALHPNYGHAYNVPGTASTGVSQSWPPSSTRATVAGHFSNTQGYVPPPQPAPQHLPTQATAPYPAVPSLQAASVPQQHATWAYHASPAAASHTPTAAPATSAAPQPSYYPAPVQVPSHHAPPSLPAHPPPHAVPPQAQHPMQPQPLHMPAASAYAPAVLHQPYLGAHLPTSHPGTTHPSLTHPLTAHVSRGYPAPTAAVEHQYLVAPPQPGAAPGLLTAMEVAAAVAQNRARSGSTEGGMARVSIPLVAAPRRAPGRLQGSDESGPPAGAEPVELETGSTSSPTGSDSEHDAVEDQRAAELLMQVSHGMGTQQKPSRKSKSKSKKDASQKKERAGAKRRSAESDADSNTHGESEEQGNLTDGVWKAKRKRSSRSSAKAEPTAKRVASEWPGVDGSDSDTETEGDEGTPILRDTARLLLGCADKLPREALKDRSMKDMLEWERWRKKCQLAQTDLSGAQLAECCTWLEARLHSSVKTRTWKTHHAKYFEDAKKQKGLLTPAKVNRMAQLLMLACSQKGVMDWAKVDIMKGMGQPRPSPTATMA